MDNPLPPDDNQLTNPHSVLDQIRMKVDELTQEYSAGKINAVQFNAIYKHYIEKRMIIEKLVERDPDTSAWRAAASSGQTTYLRDRFEARPLYFVVFRKGEQIPLLSEGKLPSKAAERMFQLLRTLWKMKELHAGIARKPLSDGMWVVMAVEDQAITLTVYFLQPSTIQMNQLKDLHHDFERANRTLLQRRMGSNLMVFPQRALIEI